MSQINRCVPDAWVRGASHPLPSDPTEFDWPDRTPVGCNHMVCLECKAEVKHQDGYRLPLDFVHKEKVPARAKQMHESAEWLDVEGIESEPKYRLYTCRCFYHSLWQLALTFNPDRTDVTAEPTRNLPWTCAGHPPLEVPDAAQLAKTVVEAAKDPAQKDVVLGLFFRTHHGSLEGVVARALAEAAAAPAPLAPAMKELFAAQTQLAPVTAFTEELIRYQRNVAPADPERRAQLIDVLTSAVEQRPSGVEETGTLQLLRDEALDGITTSAQLQMFEFVDHAWLAANVKKLVAKNKDNAGAVLARGGRAMLHGATDPDAELRTLGALARKTGVDAETLTAQAEAALGILALDSADVLAAIKGA